MRGQHHRAEASAAHPLQGELQAANDAIEADLREREQADEQAGARGTARWLLRRDGGIIVADLEGGEAKNQAAKLHERQQAFV